MDSSTAHRLPAMPSTSARISEMQRQQDTGTQGTPSAPALDGWENWPQNHPSYISLFDGVRSRNMFCGCRHPECRRCDERREVFHVSEYTASGREVVNEKVNALQLQNYLKKWESGQIEERPSFRLFFLSDDYVFIAFSCRYMRRFLAYCQTPPRFVLNTRTHEIVPSFQVATEVQSNGAAPSGNIAAGSAGIDAARILHILIQLPLAIQPADTLSHRDYYTPDCLNWIRDRSQGVELTVSNTMLYLRYSCPARECTMLVAENTSVFHYMREFCASSNAVIGGDDPFVLIAGYMEHLLIQSQNTETVPRLSLIKWTFAFTLPTPPGFNTSGLFREMNDMIAMLPSLAKKMDSMVRTIEHIKQEHKRFLDTPGIAVAQDVASMVEERLDAQLRLASELHLSFLSLAASFQRLSDMFLGFAQIQNGITTNTIATDNQKQAEATEALALDARRDSEIMKRDSATMKTITVVTLVYLPATFVSTLLSMGIFDFGVGAGGDGRIRIAREGWLFLAISLPLTAFTLGLAYLWKQLKERQWGREAQAERIAAAARRTQAAAAAGNPVLDPREAQLFGHPELRRRLAPRTDLEAAMAQE